MEPADGFEPTTLDGSRTGASGPHRTDSADVLDHTSGSKLGQ
jgi:hypothetical protein